MTKIAFLLQIVPAIFAMVVPSGQIAAFSRSKRDLIGYNRAQNNVLSHLRVLKNDNENDLNLKFQILKFVSQKRKNIGGAKLEKYMKNIGKLTRNSKIESNKRGRFSRFRNFHS